MNHRRALNRFARRVALAVGVGATLIAPNVAGAPAAHAQLLSAVDPPDRAVLTDGPSQLRLRFDRPIRRIDTQLDGPNGSVAIGTLTRESESTFVASVPSLSVGSYEIGWEATSEAGSVRTGSTSFRIVAATTTAPPTPPPTPPSSPAPTPASTIVIPGTGPRPTSPGTIPPPTKSTRPASSPTSEPRSRSSAAPPSPENSTVRRPSSTAVRRPVPDRPGVAVGVASILPASLPTSAPPPTTEKPAAGPSSAKPTDLGSPVAATPRDTITLDDFPAPTSPTIGNELAGALHTTPAMDALGGDGAVIGTDPSATNSTAPAEASVSAPTPSPEDPELRKRRMVTGVAGAAFVLLGLALFIVRRKR